MVIYALVEASSEEQALEHGQRVFDQLVGFGPGSAPLFDYYVTFDDESTTVAGKARWGDLPVAAPVTSLEGEQLIERGWTTTRDTFDRNLERVKSALAEFSADEIMHDKALSRHACYKVGSYEGPEIALYTETANAIRDRTQLDSIVASDEDLWVVPADVHY